MNFNNKFSGSIMMILGVAWFIINSVLVEIFPTDYSNLELNFATTIFQICYFIIIYFYVPFWFIDRGYKEVIK